MLPFFSTSSRFAFDSLSKQEHCHASGLRFAGSCIEKAIFRSVQIRVSMHHVC